MDLIGRRRECEALDELLAAVQSGRSRAVVLCGEAGIGKTALLDEMARRATGIRVVRLMGIESEMEFAFSALHQLCTTLADGMGRLTAPQADALGVALGERDGPTPDPFLVGLGVLNLMSEAALERGLVVLVDDQHWLDPASARVLAFVGRRLAAEAVGLVFATRVRGDELRGLPELAVDRLRDDDSRALLAQNLDGPLDRSVRNRIIAEAHGNPLALLELPRSLSRAELAGGFGEPGAPASHSLEATYRRQLEALPRNTRRLLALAAAEPTGDPAVLWRAAEVLGLDADAAVPALELGLAEIGNRVLFRHPLVRSTAYRCVPLSDRQTIHGALAAVTDARRQPDRRAWHLGHAAIGPDERVADELARSAGRVRARGGVTAAAVFLQRASELTIDPARRVDLATEAAAAKAQAGAFDAARDLLGVAESAPLTGLQRARADLVRAQLAMVSRHGNDAAPLLLAAARRLEDIDPARARDTYLDALAAGVFAGRLAVDGGIVEAAKAAATAAVRIARTDSPADLLLRGLATQLCDGFEQGLPTLRQAIHAYGRPMTPEDELRWMFLACLAAARLWDIDRHTALSARYLELARASGTITQLPLALSSRVIPLILTGHFAEAARAIDEMCTAIEAMGNNLTPFSAIVLAAMRGDGDTVDRLGAAARADAERRGEGFGLTAVAWAQSLVANGRGDYQSACAAASYASQHRGDASAATWWSLPELIEASVRLRDVAMATATLDRLAEMTTPSATDWSLGVEARSRALVSEGDVAEGLYLEAVERFEHAGLHPDLGRARLVYGEWLRRQRRRVDARAQLRSAHDLFESIGMAAFADRARRELLATGEHARRRTEAPPRTSELTAQENHIAQLARDGLSNPEIGARLFISARTVQYHLGKVFTKLGIESRSQLSTALPDPVDH
ncbi:helix-turn-helix transcriptional regulator [Mycobacterium sp. SMC-4]|uniref:helix-turn-helix transcriptional regulator n=1 Tax=Mycobacterium sp. SMC-4 TaxID=2857059 RepID=UPI003D0636B1